MPALTELLALAGNWTGTNVLHYPPGEQDSTPATARIESKLGDRFVLIEYTWSQNGTPQNGLILVGHDPKTEIAIAEWVDSWHMGRAILHLVGEAGLDGTINLKGSYPAPPGPDWGWRIVLGQDESKAYVMKMYNIEPEGAEEIAVDATYLPA